MPKGKCARRKAEKHLQRCLYQEVAKKEKQEDDVKLQEDPLPAEDPPVSLDNLFKSEELHELRNIFNIKDLIDVPLLIAAVAIGKFDIVKRLLREGHHIDCYGPGKQTPLMMAVRNMALEMIELLVSKGADVTLEDTNGDNAIMIALQDRRWVQETFFDLWNSVKDDSKLDINHSNSVGNTMFHYAVHMQWEHFIESLLEKNVDINCTTNRGVTPLILAGSSNHCNMVNTLLRAGAKISVEDATGCTVLCYAFSSMVLKGRNNPTVERLIAALNSEDDNESTMKIDDYIERRLELLVNPPIDELSYAKIIAKIMTNVMCFLVRFVVIGIELLLELSVFDTISEAVRRHLHNPDYCHALMSVLYELVRYCKCCFSGGQSLISEGEIGDAFVDAGTADACLNIMQTHCTNEGSTKLLLVAALMPLFSVCGVTIKDEHQKANKSLVWLENHYYEVKPFFHSFNEMCVIAFNFKANHFHKRLVKDKIKAFKDVMIYLELKLEDLVECKLNVNRQFLTLSQRSRRKAAKAMRVKLDKIRSQTLMKINLNNMTSILELRFIKKKSPGIVPEIEEISDNTEFNAADCSLVQEEDEIVAISEPDVRISNEPARIGKEPVPICKVYTQIHKEPVHTIKEPVQIVKEHALQSRESLRDLSTSQEPVVDVELESQPIEIPEPEIPEPQDDPSPPVKSRKYCPDDNKELTGGAYLENLFQDILDKFIEVWQWEKDHLYPGHLVDKLPNGEDATLQKLEQCLPILEQECVSKLNLRWQSLIMKLRQSDKNTFHRYVGHLDILLQCFLQGIEISCAQSSDVDSDSTEVSLAQECSKSNGSVSALVIDNDLKKKQELAKENEGDSSMEEQSPPVTVSYEMQSRRAWVFERNEERRVNEPPSSSNVEDDLQKNFPILRMKARKEEVQYKYQGRVRRVGVLKQIITRDAPLSGKYFKKPAPAPKIRILRKNRNGLKKQYNVKTIATSSVCNLVEPINVTPPPGFPENPSQSAWNVAEISRILALSPERSLEHRTGCYVTENNTPDKQGTCTLLHSPSFHINHINDGFSWAIAFLEANTTCSSVINLANNGFFGEVRAGAANDGPPLTFKCIHFDDPRMGSFMKEVLIVMQGLRHENIVHYTAFHLENNVMLVANTLCKYNLADYMLQLRKDVALRATHTVKCFIVQMMTGLCYLHTLQTPIIHGNLKPSNVLVDSVGVVKLADFGLNYFRLSELQHKPLSALVATQVWWSCETQLKYRQHSAVFLTQKSDIQIIGMLIHYVETEGLHPFGCDDIEIVNNIYAGKVCICETIDPYLEDLVLWMLSYDCNYRPSIVFSFKHPYFWDDVRKWNFVLACTGTVAKYRTIPFAEMDDIHSYFDARMVFHKEFGSWKSSLFANGGSALMEIAFVHFSDTISGLLRFIRECAQLDQSRQFFTTIFPTLPLTLYSFIVSTGWMKHPAVGPYFH